MYTYARIGIRACTFIDAVYIYRIVIIAEVE